VISSTVSKGVETAKKATETIASEPVIKQTTETISQVAQGATEVAGKTIETLASTSVAQSAAKVTQRVAEFIEKEQKAGEEKPTGPIKAVRA